MSNCKGSLSEQVLKLKNTLNKRDKKRKQQKLKRQLSLDPEEKKLDVKRQNSNNKSEDVEKSTARATGGICLGPSAGILDKSNFKDYETKPTFECSLCQVSFMNKIQYSQHISGPVHKKASDKLKAKQKNDSINSSNFIAETAMQAAGWHAVQGEIVPNTKINEKKMYNTSIQHKYNNDIKLNNELKSSNTVSHEEMVSKALTKETSLCIDGWFPPLLGDLGMNSNDNDIILDKKEKSISPINHNNNESDYSCDDNDSETESDCDSTIELKSFF